MRKMKRRILLNRMYKDWLLWPITILLAVFCGINYELSTFLLLYGLKF